MLKVLLVCDRKNWAYDSIARSLVKHNTNKDVFLDIFYLKHNELSLTTLSKKYDLLFFLGWQLILEESRSLISRKKKFKKRFSFLDNERILTGIHSHHAWDNRLTTPERNVLPPQELVESLDRFRGVNAVSQRLTKLFVEAELKKCRYTPNGVDDSLFAGKEPLGKSKDFVVVGVSTNRKHDWRKGVSTYVEPLERYQWIKLKVAILYEENYVPLEEMPHFYNQMDIYLCASLSEGFSLSVLEASACGRPVVSTKISGCEELIIDGYNGLFVKRDLDDIVSKLEQLHRNRNQLIEMGINNRCEVEKKWSWRIRTQNWVDFIKESANA